jgi:coproporphyrinogen III oxidase-like Fe-S oxidoreductase
LIFQLRQRLRFLLRLIRQRIRRLNEHVLRLHPSHTVRSAGELAAFGLRMTAGWPLAEFKERTGFDLTQEWASEIKQLIDLGYGCLDQHGFRLTQHGLRYADWAAELFLRL